jgi:hypothetical protein
VNGTNKSVLAVLRHCALVAEPSGLRVCRLRARLVPRATQYSGYSTVVYALCHGTGSRESAIYSESGPSMPGASVQGVYLANLILPLRKIPAICSPSIPALNILRQASSKGWWDVPDSRIAARPMATGRGYGFPCRVQSEPL